MLACVLGVRVRAIPQTVPCDKKIDASGIIILLFCFFFSLEAVVFQPAFNFWIASKRNGEGGRGANLILFISISFAKTSMRHKQPIYQVYHYKFFNARF